MSALVKAAVIESSSSTAASRLADSTVDVSVSWKEDMSWEAICPAILAMKQPEVILWYMGAYGLKQGSIDYHKPHISRLIDSGTGCRVNLFDLAAWGAFLGRGKLTASNRCVRMVNDLAIPWLRAIPSSHVFTAFGETAKASKVTSYIHDTVMKRSFIHRASTAFKDNGITIGKVFAENCPILEPIYEMDTSKAYSAIQYLEGMYLIEKLVRERLSEKGDINIVFALPNDESKYYRGDADEADCFQKDLAAFLERSFPGALKDRKVNVHFLNFKYGEKPSDRPYNARTKVARQVTLNQIVAKQGEVQMASSTMSCSSQVDQTVSLRKTPAKVPGFTDYDPAEQVLFDKMKKVLMAQYALNGFNPFEVAPFVHKAFLLRKGGISHEIYAASRIHGNDPTNFGLAFDRTVPFALWIRDHKSEVTFPYKRYDVSLSYRGEKPAPGRFRGFYQADVDIVGPRLELSNDVQCISALIDGLGAVLAEALRKDQRGFTMYLNHISVPKALFASAGVKDVKKLAEGMRIVDKMDKIGLENVYKELCELLMPEVEEKTIEALVKVFSYKGPLSGFSLPDGLDPKASEGLKDLNTIIEGLLANGANPDSLHFCPGMVRGLDYYTGVVFETFLHALPRSAGSVMSGGRYDELVDCFTEDAKGRARKTGIEGVGGSIGLTRLFDVLTREKLIQPAQKTACKVMVLTRGQISANSYKMVRAMKEAGLSCDLYTGSSGNIGKQLQTAQKVGVPVAVMIMEDGHYCVKEMRTGLQFPDKDAGYDLDSIERCVDYAQAILGVK